MRTIKDLKAKLLKYISPLPVFEKIWLLAPVAIWFSYRPLLSFGQNTSTNFEASPTLIYIVLLALCGLPLVWQHRKSLFATTSVRLVTTFMILSALSIAWSTNVTRGVLTLGVISALYAVFLATLADRQHFQKILPLLVKLYVISAVVMSLAAVAQVFAGVWAHSNQALLCRGCVATQFGFARPNVFTIEPQFLGNILLIPVLVLAYKLLQRRQNVVTVTSLFIITTALFLTLSRGAIFACAIGLIITLLAIRPSLWRTTEVAALFAVGLLTCLFIQGTAAVLNPRISTSFRGAVSASIDQLSLGVIDLRSKRPETPAVLGTPTTSTAMPVVVTETSAAKTSAAKITRVFTGYVEESTNVRLKLSKLSLRSWAKSPGRMIFGVGVGGSGVTLQHDFPDQVNPHEIVQNEFAEVLLENGLFGLGLFVAIIAGLAYALRGTKWLWAIVAAFVVQWNFFSGYPNALHMYVVLIALLVVAASPRAAHESV